MADNEAKAQDLYAQAEKKAKSTGGFLGFFGGSSKQEEATELYVRAANTFKMAKKWGEAGKCFKKSAKLHKSMKETLRTATDYAEAAKCFKKVDATEAVNCLLKAIEIYTDMGRFTIAAKHHITIAEIYESESIDLDKAIKHYEQAADYYKGEESNSSANKCLLKVAQYASQQEQYDKAIEIYEAVATQAMDNQLLKYGAKDYFFRATLCRMCQEVEDATTTIGKYEEMFPAFSDSRECKLVKTLISCIEEQNVDGFTEAVREYDSISRIEQWYTTMLLRIKKNIEGDVDLR